MNMTESNQTFQCKFGEVINLSEQERKDIQEQAYKDGYQDGLDGKHTIKQLMNLTKSAKYMFSDKEKGATAEQIESILKFDDTENVLDFAHFFGGDSNSQNSGNNNITRMPNLDFSRAENMEFFASNCPNFVNFNTVDWTRISNIKSLTYFANACKKITESPNGWDTRRLTAISYVFYSCEKLRVVHSMDLQNVNVAQNSFAGCKALEELWLKNINTSLQIASGTSYGHLLTTECLLQIVGELIKSTRSRTLTMGSTNLAKIADTYVRVVDITEEMFGQDEFIYDKMPFEICESTDEGAMLISDYVRLKNWVLA